MEFFNIIIFLLLLAFINSFNSFRTCVVCVAKRGPSEKGKSELQIYNSDSPFERLQMNIFGPFLVSSSGNKYLLVISDCFIKWVENGWEAFSIKIFRTKTIAEILVNQVILRFGILLELYLSKIFFKKGNF